MRVADPFGRRAKALAKPIVKRLARFDATPLPLRLQWAKARLQAAAALQPVYRGMRVEWDRPEHAWCVPFDVAGPGYGDVLLRTTLSAISPGTETAFFARRPNTSVTYPSVPGYSGTAEVVEVGRGVRDLEVGQRVAVETNHASLSRVAAGHVVAVPDGVHDEDAALIHGGMLAVQCAWSVDLARAGRIAILGRGLIGQLAMRVLRAEASAEIISLAPSRRRVTQGLRRYADRVLVTAGDDADAIDGLDARVTIESSGDPRAVVDAVRATRPGGTVVLLGSPRGTTHGFPLGLVAQRRLHIVGVHVNALPATSADGRDRVHAKRRFLDLLADGSVGVDDLPVQLVDPMEAGWWYTRLAGGDATVVRACFDWRTLPDHARMARVGALAGPDVSAAVASHMHTGPVGLARNPFATTGPISGEESA